MSNLKSPEVFIAVMGYTGAGKSYFIKKVSGIDTVTIGNGLQSCTLEVSRYSFMRGNTKISLLDTPSFVNTEESEKEIRFKIGAKLELMHKKKRHLTGIVYLHNIDVGMEGSPLVNLEIFKRVCGDKSMKNVILASRSDRISGTADSTTDAELQAMLDKGAQLSRFDGSTESGLAIIDSLLGRETTVLAIQERRYLSPMVKKKLGLSDSDSE